MNYFFALLFSCLTSITFSQDVENKTDFLNEIASYDISHLWTTNRIRIEEDTTTIERHPPLGFIGESYQRLFIHFTSVIKNPVSTNEYLVYGKSKVKDNICEFQGTIKIEESYTYDFEDLSRFKQGFVKGTYEFYENPNEKGSGIFKGKFSTEFFIDDNQEIQYNGLMLIADGFKNNQFEGTWTSYATGKGKMCNWGDYRIPNSGDLDIGAGEFSPSEKYTEMGWSNYRLAYRGYDENEFTQKALRKEKEQWWKN